MSFDDVTDFIVTEAVAVKVSKQDQEAEEKARRDEWAHNYDDLRRQVPT